MSFWMRSERSWVKQMDEKELIQVVEELYDNAMRMVSFLDEDIQAVLLEEDEENEEDLIW